MRLAVLGSGPWVVLMLRFLGNAVGFLNCSLCVGKALQCWVGIQFLKCSQSFFKADSYLMRSYKTQFLVVVFFVSSIEALTEGSSEVPLYIF